MNGRGLLVALGGLALVGAGAALAMTGITLQAVGMRWVVWLATGLLGLTWILAVRGRTDLLVAAFVLSIQVDVSFRLFYGKGGSDGLAMPLTVLAGIGLLAIVGIKYGGEALRGLYGLGSMRLPVIALFATSLLAMLTTSERFVGITRLLFELQLVFVYWLTANLVRREEDFRFILRLLMGVLLLQSLVYFVQSALGIDFTLAGGVRDAGKVPRPGGTVATNPAGFASAIMPLLMVALTMLASGVTLGKRRYTALAVLLGVTALGLTYTRAAYVGFVLAVGIVSLLGLRRRIVRVGVIAGIALFGMILASFLLPAMLFREKEYSSGEAFDARNKLIEIAVNVIRHHPITGVGPGAYPEVYKAYKPEGWKGWEFEVHNEMVLRAAECGLVGGLAWILFLLAAMRRALWLSRDQEPLFRVVGVAWFAALCALTWQMQWVPWRGFNYNALLWMMVGLVDGALRLKAPAPETVTLPSVSRVVPGPKPS